MGANGRDAAIRGNRIAHRRTRMTNHCTEWAYNCCRDARAVVAEGHVMLDLACFDEILARAAT